MLCTDGSNHRPDAGPDGIHHLLCHGQIQSLFGAEMIGDGGLIDLCAAGQVTRADGCIALLAEQL